MKKGIIICASIIAAFGLSGCSSASEVSSVPKVSQTNGETNHSRVEMVEGKLHSAAYVKIARYMEEECKKAFSAHYVLIEFIISDYAEKTANGKVEATFGYKVIYQNHEKDPDTVGYIKEAKEKGDPQYQQLYDEYLQPKEMNFELKAVIDHTDSVELYANVNPKGTQWQKVVMTDFVLHE